MLSSIPAPSAAPIFKFRAVFAEGDITWPPAPRGVGTRTGAAPPAQRLPSGEADKCSSTPEGSGKKEFCRTQACGSVGRPACLRRHTFLSSARKVCKRSSLKEENPFDWVFSLKNLSFLNDQSGGGPFGNPELWRGACRGCPHRRQAKRAQHCFARCAIGAEFRRQSGAWARRLGDRRQLLRATDRLRRARRAAARREQHLVLALVFCEGISCVGGVCNTLCGNRGKGVFECTDDGAFKPTYPVKRLFNRQRNDNPSRPVKKSPVYRPQSGKTASPGRKRSSTE